MHFHDSDPDFCGWDLYGVRDGQAGGAGRSEDDHAPPPAVPEDVHAPPPPAPVDVLFHDSDPDFCGTDLYGVRDGQAGGTGRSEDDHAPPPAVPEDAHAPPPPAPVDVHFHDSDPDFCGTDLYGVRDGQAGGTDRSEDDHAPPPAAPEDAHAPPLAAPEDVHAPLAPVDVHAPPAPVKLLPEVEVEVEVAFI